MTVLSTNQPFLSIVSYSVEPGSKNGHTEIIRWKFSLWSWSIIALGSGYFGLKTCSPLRFHQNQSCTRLSTGIFRSRYFCATPSNSSCDW